MVIGGVESPCTSHAIVAVSETAGGTGGSGIRACRRAKVEPTCDGRDALVLDEIHPVGCRDLAGLVRADVELEPECGCTDLGGCAGDVGCVGGGTKDVDEVDVTIDVAQVRDRGNALHVVEGVDGDDVPAARDELHRRAVRRLGRVGGETNHGDRAAAREEHCGVVGIGRGVGGGVGVHGASIACER